MDLSLQDLLAQTKLFVHGSTVVDNIVLTRAGSKVGLITTRGFEDTLLMTRAAYGRWGGLTEDRIKHPVKTNRPPSLVEPDCIVGVAERVDYKGEILLRLDAAEAERAVRFLVEQHQVEAIAVSFLWSFANADNERRMRDAVSRIAPQLYCTLSSEVAPVPGEYERTSTTAINAYAGHTTRNYLNSLSKLLIAAGYDGALMVMQGYGGLLPAEEAVERSIGMLECGPAAGVIGSRALGQLLDQSDVIATDMGGTTFKVSVIQNHEIEYAREPMVDRYHYTQPKIEVVSIGAGGGSIVSFDAGSSSLRIGPRSAGSRPGPACYGLGGSEPTVTDVLMLIGYMDPDIFLGGSMKLDRDAAKRVFDAAIATPLGMTTQEAAFGAYRVACAQIADLIHEITVERGLDPREFVLHAFGGCCGMLAGVFGSDLHVKQIVVPYTASVNCAFGLVSADIAHEYATTKTLPAGASPDEINAIYEPMVARALKTLAQEGFRRRQGPPRSRGRPALHAPGARSHHPAARRRSPDPRTARATGRRLRNPVRAQIRQGFRLSRSWRRDDDVPAHGARHHGPGNAGADGPRQTGCIRRAGRQASDLRRRGRGIPGGRHLRLQSARTRSCAGRAGGDPHADHDHRPAGQPGRAGRRLS